MAEDLTSLTFERALETIRRSDFRNESFGGWLYRVASNAVVDHVRRSGRLLGLAEAEGAGEPLEAATDAFAAALDREEVRQALLRLPARHREVLLLKFYDDLEPDEMCGLLACSREAFAVRLHRALRALRAAIAEESADVA